MDSQRKSDTGAVPETALAEREKLLLLGLNTGKDIPLDKNFWKDLRGEARRMAHRRRPQ